MIDLTDLGLVPVESAATLTPGTVVVANTSRDKGLVPGSVKARLLFGAYKRQPVQVVDSPPGAGKTQLVIEALEVLLKRSPFKMVVACPTKRGAADLAGRLAQLLGNGLGAPAVALGVKDEPLPPGCVRTVPQGKNGVTVRTVASCTYSPPTCDILLVDEAYQVTFADAMAAGDGADSVILVGDPGQIGPVITQNVNSWATHRNAPHRRAPEIFAARPDAVVLQLDATYRLGPATVEAIAPLYGFAFESRRVARQVVDHDGTPITELTSLAVPDTGGVADFATLKTVAARAAAMVGTTVETFDSDGDPVTLTVGQDDVAVVVSHNVQASSIQGMLRGSGLPDIAVGTADRMQGGQWLAVVALDPLVGHTTISPHQINPGRLCVMASRHMSTLTWVHDGAWEDKLTAAAAEHPEAKVGIAVRRALTADGT